MRTVFTGAEVFDGTGAALAGADVAVEDGAIVEVGSGLDGDESVDVSGQTLLPGLFDTHVHVMIAHIDIWRHVQTPFSYGFFQAIHTLQKTLDIGITTVRDAGGADLGLKQALEDGLIAGPRVQISIAMLSPTSGHADGWMPSGTTIKLLGPHPGLPSPICDGVSELRKKVREMVRAGAEVIKCATTGGVISPRDHPEKSSFSPEELDALVGEAKAHGLEVMAHAQGAPGIKNALRAGMRSIEHGIYLDDEATTKSAAELMKVDRVLGTIEPGKRADLVVVDGDPFEFTTLKERITAVYQDGRLVAHGERALVA